MVRQAVNVADLSPADDKFTTLAPEVLHWKGFSGLPANRFERSVPKLRVSRYRAAFQAAAALKPDGIIVSHLPLMTAATSVAMVCHRKSNRHLAFSFNFTGLPTGGRLAYLRRAFRTVEQFAVFSHFEHGLYAEQFDLPPTRIKPVIWTQEAPGVDAQPALPPGVPYVCAIGGEGRDFSTLLEAVRMVGAGVRCVIIARPHSLEGLSVPDNVEVLTNIPSERVWRIACDSQGVLIPLKTPETCCGHITLVSAKLLGLPIATTRSLATREYVEGRPAVLECEPGDPAEFSLLIQRLFDEQAQLSQGARGAMESERHFHDREQWADYLREFVGKSASA